MRKPRRLAPRCLVERRARFGARASLHLRSGLGVLLAASAVGCSGDTTGPAPLSAAQAYWALHLNVHAVNLSLTPPSDTVHLTAVPVNAAGVALTGLQAATYTTADSSVTVSPAGLVTAHYPTTSTTIVAALQYQGVTLADTVFLQVTPAPLAPPLATFSLQPAPGDSAKRDFSYSTDGNFFWPVTATGGVGDTVCNGNGCVLLVDYRSSNPSVARIDRKTGQVTISDVGATEFTATTLAYGQVWRDSVRFRVGYPLSAGIHIVPGLVNGQLVPTFSHPVQIVGIGATVTWAAIGDSLSPQVDSIDVTFTDPTAVQPGQFCLAPTFCLPPTGGGNIPPTQVGTDLLQDLFARSFPVAGTYPYHSQLYGDTGAIVVRPDAP